MDYILTRSFVRRLFEMTISYIYIRSRIHN